ncbi:winged helix-turn-helix domain-containing protein [Streptomyces pseudovenezuelae]|uniref:DNA-binding transcriptional regulator YhcF (GntR family) n=1 Tax=Streptomyces pseudovenezuelae TaxID=67350 RepID=A0ABT6LSY2_9ACTN|nr:winged helix-turn-helix domain-containing protein [Streptomyces pseudovenezuelae]MDH6218519.1 DNA-binding transcriptional regulator YhcF (GntR family) [Streptomyces pseudovenezuelae]
MDGQSAEGGGREFQRVSDELRVRMTDGTYVRGSFLPSQRDLAEEFGVSRDTVQRAIRELVDEGWIESRQGSGSRVIRIQRIQSSTPRATRTRRGMTLGPLISEAFEAPEVTLDVQTLTSESLDMHIRLQGERIHGGVIRPERIALRMLLPDESMPLPYPRVKGDKDDPRPRERLQAITQRATDSLQGLLEDLQTERLVDSVDVQVRHAPLIPTFKLYLLNGVEVLHGMYEVIERPMQLGPDGEVVTALDVLGLGATLTHHVKDHDPESPGSVFVDTMQTWFDSVWDLLAE